MNEETIQKEAEEYAKEFHGMMTTYFYEFHAYTAGATKWTKQVEELKEWKKEAEKKLVEAGQAMGMLSQSNDDLTAERDKLQKEIDTYFHAAKETNDELKETNEKLTAEVERLKKHNEIKRDAITIEQEALAELRNKVIEECAEYIFKRTIGAGHDIATYNKECLESLKSKQP